MNGVQAEVLALATRFAIGCSKYVDQSVGVSSNEVHHITEARVFTAVGAFVAAAGGIAEEQLENEEWQFEQQVQQ